MKGKKILVIDLDPQGNATTGLDSQNYGYKIGRASCRERV